MRRRRRTGGTSRPEARPPAAGIIKFPAQGGFSGGPRTVFAASGRPAGELVGTYPLSFRKTGRPTTPVSRSRIQLVSTSLSTTPSGKGPRSGQNRGGNWQNAQAGRGPEGSHPQQGGPEGELEDPER